MKLPHLLSQLRQFFSWERIHSEIEEEREFHIAMRAEELMRGGMSRKDADARSRRRFGRSLRLHEMGFEVRGGGWLPDAWADFRHALRALAKSPGRTAALVTTIALGISVNVAVFSVIKSVVLDALPFADSNRLVSIHQVSKGHPEGVSYPNFENWRSAATGFTSLAVYASDSSILNTADPARRIAGAVVSANFFDVLRVQPLRGRIFAGADDFPHSERTVVISQSLWSTQYHEREDIVGQSLTLDGVGYRVIGVVADRFAFPIRPEPVSYWITTAIDAEASPWGGSVRQSRGYPRYDAALGRLKDGVSIARAGSEIQAITARIAREHPRVDLRGGAQVLSTREDLSGNISPMLWTMYGAVFCVLAVACANAATLILVDATARRREFALRSALGARPMRLVRQLLVETQTTAILGGVCGALMAWFLVALLVQIAPPEIPRLASNPMDWTGALYAFALSVLAGFVLGFAPVFTSLGHHLVETIKDRTSLKKHLSSLLIGAQIALTVVLGCGAALLTGSFWRILHVERGLDASHVLAASLTLPATSYPEGSPAVAQYYADLMQDVRRLPGVTSAGIAQSLPLSGENNSTRVDVAGTTSSEIHSADLRFVSPEYFPTLRIPLLEGRYLGGDDRRDRHPVVVVNRAFVNRILGGAPPIGTYVRLGWGGDAPKEIVGVVGDVLHHPLGAQAMPEVYVPAAQFPLNSMSLLVRGANVSASALSHRIHQKDSRVALERVRLLDDYLLLSIAPQRFLMSVIAVFAIGTLLLAGVGLYGSLSYSAALRKREFGIRLALGSTPAAIRKMVVRQGLAITGGGIAAGLLLTASVSRFLGAWLYHTSPLDPFIIVIAISVLLAASLVACWMPVKRAIDIDVAISLRSE